MKMYVCQASTIHTNRAAMVAGVASESIEIPVPFFLFEHEKGYVLYDTGHSEATIKDTKAAIGEALYAGFRPELNNDNHVLSYLKKVGVSPEDIKYVICSHLHFDHCGGMGYFPNATYIVQRAELQYAYVPDYFYEFAYLREDFDKGLNWLFLNGWADNKHDVFGDGRLVIYYTPGHTPGHQSLMVNLDNDGTFMLTADACYTYDNLNDFKLSGLVADNSAYASNIMMFRDMRNRGINVLLGHDPDQWKTTKKFPEFYS